MSRQLTSYLSYGPYQLSVEDCVRLVPIKTDSLDELAENSDKLLRVHFDTRSLAGYVEPTGIMRVTVGVMELCVCDIRTWETTYHPSIQFAGDLTLMKAQLSAFIHETLLSWNDTSLLPGLAISGSSLMLTEKPSNGKHS